MRKKSTLLASWILCMFPKKQTLLVSGILLMLSELSAAPPTRIILNGANIIIAEGAQLVVENSSPAAITRYDGSIISEGEDNIIKWNIGTATGDYVVPLGDFTSYFPLTFTSTDAVGGGYFNFATYSTPWNNSSQLPTGIAQVNDEFGLDNSAFVIDRFWLIEALDYSVKPTLSNLQFTYLDAEHSAVGNTITEGNLGVQRYEEVTMYWGGYPPSGSVNTADNTVTVAFLEPSELYPWWTMADASSPLPISLLSFTAYPEGSTVRLNWVSETEINNDYFTLAKSLNGIDFETVAKADGAGNSTVRINYTTVDNNPWRGVSYYRLMQTDFDGRNSFSNLVSVLINQDSDVKFNLHPNPTNGNDLTLTFSSTTGEMIQIKIFNDSGNKVYEQTIPTIKEANFTTTIDLPKGLPEDVYFIKIDANTSTSTKKFILINN